MDSGVAGAHGSVAPCRPPGSVDTGAFLAVLDAHHARHTRASRVWSDLVGSEEHLLTTSYVLVETFALMQARVGRPATRLLNDDLLPIVGSPGRRNRCIAQRWRRGWRRSDEN